LSVRLRTAAAAYMIEFVGRQLGDFAFVFGQSSFPQHSFLLVCSLPPKDFFDSIDPKPTVP
jgi:hypothetical protein